MSLFSSAIRYKKIIFFVFLFSAVIISVSPIVTPKIISAQGIITGRPIEGPNSPAALAMQTEHECGVNKLSFWKSIVAGIADVFIWVPKQLAKLVAYLSDFISNEMKDWTITNGDKAKGTKAGAGAALAFTNGWKSSRDLANMLIILGFVIVGVATTLRIREYEAKKALWPLIVVAIFVNFSGLVCGLIIDASSITTSGLLSSAKSDVTNTNGTKEKASPALAMYTTIERSDKDLGCAALKSGILGQYLMIKVLFGFMYLSVGLSFLLLVAVLFARYAILGILFMLSPLAFAAWGIPLPDAKSLFSKWWNSFLKWAFVGVCIAFFLNIAKRILEESGVLKKTISNEALNNDSYWTSIGQIFGYLGVAEALIIAGIMVTIKQSGVAAVAAKAITGAAGAAVGFAAGAVAGGGAALGRTIDKATGGHVSSGIQKLSAGTGRALEAMGFRAAGTTAGRSAGQMKEARDRVDNLRQDQQTQMAKKTFGVKAADKVAAIENKVKNGNLSDLGTKDEQNNALQFVEGHYKGRGLSTNIRKEAEKQNYQLAGINEKDPVKAQKLRQDQLATNLRAGMSTSAIGRIDHNDIGGEENYDFFKENITPHMVKQMDASGNRELLGAAYGHTSGLHEDAKAASASGDKSETTKLTKLENSINRATGMQAIKDAAPANNGASGPNTKGGWGGRRRGGGRRY